MKTPWDDRGRELEATEGDYCVFVAWEQWMAANDKDFDILGPIGACDRVLLWSLFEKAIEESTVEPDCVASEATP